MDEKYGAYYPAFNGYDIRQKGDGPYFPGDPEVAYLQDPKIMKAIGAKATYSECADSPDVLFDNYADCMFPSPCTSNELAL